MVELHAGIQDGHDHVGPGRLGPRFRSADRRGVAEGPLLREHRVGGGERGGRSQEPDSHPHA